MFVALRASLGFVLIGAPLAAQAGSGFRDTIVVVPGARYARGGTYRFFFGDHYRDLWTTPIRVPVLDLQRFAGGLKPEKKGGGTQTKALRFTAGNGREYQFRSVDKDPSRSLPPDLRETFAERIFQDQISSAHPAGPLVVNPILTAAGVLHPEPILVVMPDDPALGEFRSEFANVLGTLEERPRDADDSGVSFAGAKEIVSTDELFKQLDKHPNAPVDAAEFLLARLTDVFVGDWDRHADQWRWAKLADSRGEHWRPIPRDRDQALVRFDGFLLRQVRDQVPQLTQFGPKYSNIVGATWNGRNLDRRLLTGLELSVWDSVANVLKSRITDQVIDAAVARLPREYQPIDGPRLRAALKTRRDGLSEIARHYYRNLAHDVDVFGSDQPDLVIANGSEGGDLEVTIAAGDRPNRPYFRRRFHRNETGEVRLYLQGGADSAVVRSAGSGIKVRVIGGGGNDRLVKEDGGSVRFYDSRGDNTAVGAKIRDRPYQAITDTANPRALPYRDWGGKKLNYPILSFGPDAGLQLGVGGRFTNYGFRSKPYESFWRYRAVLATGAATGKVEFMTRFQRENSRSFYQLELGASGIEVLRWYGFGNFTTADPTKDLSFYRVNQHEVTVAPSIGWSLGERSVLEIGPRFKFSITELDDGKNRDRFIGEDQPFGAAEFAELGIGANLTVDTRDVPAAARRGVYFQLGGTAYPKLLDVNNTFAEVHGQISTYLTARMPTTPTLALLAGGKKVFAKEGTVPFHEAAYLGSSYTLRGFQPHRFAGEGALFGTAELRLHLTNLFLFVPGRQGVFGFTDWGRVYFRGDIVPPGVAAWHRTYGAGLWLSFLSRGSMISAAVGSSDEGTRFYFKGGFAF